jgi:hypothetical protein
MVDGWSPRISRKPAGPEMRWMQMHSQDSLWPRLPLVRFG